MRSARHGSMFGHGEDVCRYEFTWVEPSPPAGDRDDAMCERAVPRNAGLVVRSEDRTNEDDGEAVLLNPFWLPWPGKTRETG